MITGYRDLLGTQTIFLFELDANGRSWYFSTRPIDITTAAGAVISFDGQLQDPDLSEQTDMVGFSAEVDSIAIELLLIDYEVAQQRFQAGQILDGAECELSMIQLREGAPIKTYDERTLLFKGIVTEPLFGYPDQPVGYVTFSIENDPRVTGRKLIDAARRMTALTYNDLDLESAAGKLPPFILGKVGGDIMLETSGGSLYEADLWSTPAYIVDQQVASSDGFRLLVAGHVCDPTAVIDIVDFDNGTKIGAAPNVARAVDGIGNDYAYQDIAAGFPPALAGNASTSNNAGSPFYWVRWTAGGGFPNPFGAGPMTGGGDIVLWGMIESGAIIDYEAFDAMRPFLNDYQFTGYANTDIGVVEWLENEIIKFLPIEIKNGPRGLRPILSELYAFDRPNIVAQIELGRDGFSNGPFVPQLKSTDIINKLEFQFAYSGMYEKHLGTIMIDPELTEYTTMRFSNAYAELSYQRYGIRAASMSSDFISDYLTAIKVSTDIIRRRSLGGWLYDIIIAHEFGYVQMGDVIELIDTKNGLNGIQAMVISKRFSVGSWELTLYIEDNPIRNERIS